jgi:hypothetical protein
LELETIKTFSQVAGIGGISLGVFLILFRDILRKNIFPKFKSEELSYRLLRLIVIVIWSVAIIGIVSWLYISKREEKSSLSPPEWNSYSMISHQDFDNPDKNIICQSFISCGENDKWNMEVFEGQYWVENVTDQSAIHYNFMDKTNVVGDWEKIVDIGPFNPISVETTIARGESEETSPSGAGLLFRYHPGNYYLYIVSSSGDILLLQFAKGCVSVVFKEKIKGFSKSTPYKLGISGDKKNIFLYFNDNFLHSISDSKNISGLGGIVMVGKGRYAFDNLRIYNKIK